MVPATARPASPELDDAEARMIAALAACNLHDADEARRHIRHLSPSRAGLVIQSCKRNGVDLSPPDP
jgi:hypothetical protein